MGTLLCKKDGVNYRKYMPGSCLTSEDEQYRRRSRERCLVLQWIVTSIALLLVSESMYKKRFYNYSGHGSMVNDAFARMDEMMCTLVRNSCLSVFVVVCVRACVLYPSDACTLA